MIKNILRFFMPPQNHTNITTALSINPPLSPLLLCKAIIMIQALKSLEIQTFSLEHTIAV
ncbi:hypothetical protein [Helicobacter cinaedi]|uniref:hypothetical protein n=1 Tax=Helicobacter cinaedi TaxID=213 RepID=UPI001E2B46B4|nr:hypothetical protein [Helicobacter cinaedi]